MSWRVSFYNTDKKKRVKSDSFKSKKTAIKAASGLRKIKVDGKRIVTKARVVKSKGR